MEDKVEYLGKHWSFHIIETPIDEHNEEEINDLKSLIVEGYNNNNEFWLTTIYKNCPSSAFYLSRDDMKKLINLLQELLEKV
jgi:hypothetical protein